MSRTFLSFVATSSCDRREWFFSYLANLVIFGSVLSFTNTFPLCFNCDCQVISNCKKAALHVLCHTSRALRFWVKPGYFLIIGLNFEHVVCFFETVKVTWCLAPSMINSFATSSYKQIQQTEHLPPNKVHVAKAVFSLFSCSHRQIVLDPGDCAFNFVFLQNILSSLS